MSDTVNNKVKFREPWRPFALSILAEKAAEYLVNPVDAPFMVMAFEVVPGREAEIAAALHSGDRTTRPQTVRREVQSALLGADRRLPPPHRRARRAQHVVQRERANRSSAARPMRSAVSTERAWTRWRSAAFCSRSPTPDA